MIRNRKNASLLVLLLAAVLLVTVGCSTDNNPAGPVSENLSSNSGNDAPLPPVTDELIQSKLGSHYRLLRAYAEGMAVEGVNCDTMMVSRWCTAGMVNSVVIPLVTVFIPAGANPATTQFRIVAPVGCEAAADFYPHPYQFNSDVQLRWNLKALGLPDTFDYSTIVPWYIDDDGNFVQMPFSLSGDHKTLTVYTNHFSRYILGEYVE